MRFWDSTSFCCSERSEPAGSLTLGPNTSLLLSSWEKGHSCDVSWLPIGPDQLPLLGSWGNHKLGSLLQGQNQVFFSQASLLVQMMVQMEGHKSDPKDQTLDSRDLSCSQIPPSTLCPHLSSCSSPKTPIMLPSLCFPYPITDGSSQFK